MKSVYLTVVTVILAALTSIAQDKTFQVKDFDKIIISPHVEVNLIAGNETSVFIENTKVPMNKINVQVEGNTLRVYLDGAKTVTKSERVSSDNWNGKRPIYKGTMATATITYKTLKNLSVRGEEIVRCKSRINEDELKLSLYGETKVYFDDLVLNELVVAIYGSSYLEIAKGNAGRQVFRAYGESEVNTLGMENGETKITAYGESNFRVKVSDRLKVTCYGETTINYQGDPDVDNGIIIGEAKVRKIG
ncbi:head GIN domain-containing protein [Maribacter chungangensis]|uniref:Head GIN domain-containing protein n=1 Tax=Maribacter chungangensis TaxID=1069117 RepID=A0ABW3B7E0_9FLAO